MSIPALPDWDALSELERQSFTGQVQIGSWPHPFPVQSDNDRLFLDLLADSPTSEWSWFFDGGDGVHPSPDALRERIVSVFETRSLKSVASLSPIDWDPLLVRVRATASLLALPVYDHPRQNDAFALFASLFPLSAPTRPAHALMPIVSDLPELGINF